MDRKCEFENKVEELIKDFSDLSYEEIADSLEYLATRYAKKEE